MREGQQTHVKSGEQAPDFAVPAVQHDRTICLADYRGRTPLLLGLFPGLYCPFCRRALAQMASTSEHLKSLGVDSLAIVGTKLENARLYFRFRPTHMALGADPNLTTHRSYGVPRPTDTPAFRQLMGDTYVNPTGDLQAPQPASAVAEALAALDGYQLTPTDQREHQSMFTQMKGQFLIDRDGIVRWANIECGGKEGLSGLGKFPSQDDLVRAASIVIGVTR